jgi:U3 small nucleolar RNA-associated protein 21
MALFAPFRALGYITDPVPFATQKRGGLAGGGRDGRGSGGTVTVAVGRTWQAYDSSRLVLRLVGPAHPRDVTAVACKGDLTWAAAGGDIYEARRVHFTTAAAGEDGGGDGNGDGDGAGATPSLAAYRAGHRPGSRVLALMPLGEGESATLLSLGTDRQLLAWRVGQHGRRPATRIDLSSAGFGGAAANAAAAKAAVVGDPSARPTCMCHPDTYLNKVVVGFTDGTLRLYNYATGRHLYTFDVAGGGATGGGGGGVGGRRGAASAARASVTCVAASPALDVVGCGLSDGRVVVHHLRRDARVVEFDAAAGGSGAAADGSGEDGAPAPASATGSMLSLLDRGAGLGRTSAGTSALATSGAAVTALCFRPGAGGGGGGGGAVGALQPLPLLAVGGGAGGIAFWDLERRRLHAVLRDAHDAAVVSLHWFPGEPRVMSSGADNAIKQWSLDGRGDAAAPPRLLRFRGGHSAPPTVVSHYGPGGLRLLSAGADRAFRVFSTIQDQQSRELGQGGKARRAKKRGAGAKEAAEGGRLPRISALDASDARERDWSNAVTAHEGDPRAYTWRLAHFTLGEAVLQPTPTALRVVNAGGGRLAAGAAAAAASAVAVAPCGNFAAVGSAAGRVDRYNLQSGLHRGGFYRRRRRQRFGLGSEHPPLLAPMPGEEAAAAAAAAGRALLLQSSVVAAAKGGGGDQDGGDGDGGGGSGRRRNPGRSRRAATLLPGPSSYRPRPTDEVRAAHDGAVVGVAVDARGRLLVSAGADGFVRVWDFRRQQLVAEAYAGAPIARMAMHPGSGLVAVALAGPAASAGGGAPPASAPALPYALRVFDAEAGARLVRRFPGHADRVTALQLSADGRWLLSAGMDGALRVWDLPSGACAQAMAIAGPPVTALSLSPALDLLATAHANRRGVFLWANQALFGDPASVARLERGAEALAGGGGGGGGGAGSWERLVPVGLPSIGTGHERDDDGRGEGEDGGEKRRGKSQGKKGGGDEDDDDEDDDEGESSDDDGQEGMSASDMSSSSDYVVGRLVGGKRRAGGENEEDDDADDAAAAAAAAAAARPDAHEARDPRTGAPRPLAPRLATLSLLPRAQVDSLLHLDAIRARGRPLAPPKKPEAAPFFLPTVPSLAGRPVFFGSGGAAEEGEGEGEEEQEGGGGSRVKRARLAAAGGARGKHEPPPSSEFVRLLREGERRQQQQRRDEEAAAKKGAAAGGDDPNSSSGDNPYSAFIAYALSLTPVALDGELRALALLDVPADGAGGEEEDEEEAPMAQRETADLLALLTALDRELAASRNYEFCNAVLARALALHGDALSARPRLVAACAALRARLRAGWRALDALLQGVRCMADFFAGAQ